MNGTGAAAANVSSSEYPVRLRCGAERAWRGGGGPHSSMRGRPPTPLLLLCVSLLASVLAGGASAAAYAKVRAR